MKIAIKIVLIVSFIFSFFFFLSKPVNAQSFTPVVPNELLNQYIYNDDTYVPGVLVYGWTSKYGNTWYFLKYKITNVTPKLLVKNGTIGNDNSYIVLMQNSTGSYSFIPRDCYALNSSQSWVSEESCLPVFIGYEDNRKQPVSSYIYSNIDVAYYSTVARNFYWQFGNLGLMAANTYYPLFNANAIFKSSAPVVAPTYDRFMEYKDNTQSSQWLRVEFNGDMTISSSFTVGDNVLNFSGDWRLYAVAGVERVLLTSSSSFYPPHLYIADVNNPCALVLRSNWVLKDENGVAVCMATVNPIVEEIAKNFTGIVNYDTNTDLGIFEPIEPVIAWLGKVVDDVALWFHGLWVNFLNLIIPMPDFLTYAFAEVKQVASEKFAQIDVSSLNDFRELDADTMPNITTSLMGVSVTVVNFDLIKPHIDLLRSIMAATVGLFLIIFNVNQVNKLLSDNSVTEE